jgi:hypothetical protein
MSLSKEDQKYYEDLSEMFARDGWRTLVEEAKVEYDSILKYLAVEKDHGNIREAQGKLLVLDRMINLEELAHSSYDAVLAESEEQETE